MTLLVEFVKMCLAVCRFDWWFRFVVFGCTYCGFDACLWALFWLCGGRWMFRGCLSFIYWFVLVVVVFCVGCGLAAVLLVGFVCLVLG